MKIMINKDGYVFLAVLALFAFLYLAQLIAVGFFVSSKKNDVDTIIENN